MMKLKPMSAAEVAEAEATKMSPVAVEEVETVPPVPAPSKKRSSLPLKLNTPIKKQTPTKSSPIKSSSKKLSKPSKSSKSSKSTSIQPTTPLTPSTPSNALSSTNTTTHTKRSTPTTPSTPANTIPLKTLTTPEKTVSPALAPTPTNSSTPMHVMLNDPNGAVHSREGSELPVIKTPLLMQKAVSIAPKAVLEAGANASSLPSEPPTIPLNLPAVGENDVVFVDGQAFNGRGYPVCGVANQRGRRCGRIGTCPFHSRPKGGAKPSKQASSSTKPQKRPRAPSPVPSSKADSNANGTNRNAERKEGSSRSPTTAKPTNGKRSSGKGSQSVIRQVLIPPQKSRFKRSWTMEEHRIFLQAMRRYGKGKWKEISAEVKTRTANQCQSHAQKYFLRQAKSNLERKKKSIHDVTDVDVDTKEEAEIITHDAPSMAGLPPVNATPSVITMARKHTPVPLAPALSGGVVGDMSPLSHRVSPVTVSSSAALTCVGRGSMLGSPSGGLSTVPVVFPMSSLGGVQYAPMVQPYLNAGNTSGAAVVAPPPLAKLRVTVHENGKMKGGMALVLPDSFEEFFELAKSKLNCGGTLFRVFTRSGGEITCIDEMCQDDMLWLSAGGDFLTPR